VTTPSSTTVRVRRVLEQELSRGCTNDLVVGGLDRMLIQMREDGAMAEMPNLDRFVRVLPPGGYRALSADGRARWLRDAIGALGSTVTSVPAGLPPAKRPVAARRAADRRPSAPKRVAAATAGRVETGSPISALPGVTPAVATKFARLGVETAGDAARLFPRRFNDFSDVRRIAELRPSNSVQTVVADVVSAGQRRFGRRIAGSEALVQDSTGSLKAVWFNQPYVARGIKAGEKIVLAGKVREYRGRLQMDNPEFETFEEDGMAGRLIPVYPATSGLGQKTIRKVVRAAVNAVSEQVEDAIPPSLAARRELPPLGPAIRAYHYPDRLADAETARRRLALGEFLAIQAAVLQRRAEWQEQSGTPQLEQLDYLAALRESLPFGLTAAQDRALGDVLADISQPRPMLRLLQGDVGSGKTVVAFAAMMAAVAAGHQAALMVPTEILAEQHYRSFARMLGGSELSVLEGMFSPSWFGRPVRLMLLTGSLTAAQKRMVQGDAANHGVDILIGTHALLEKSVELPRLALAVVDEQHRFGVMQRARLREKGLNPHLLVMTATPIPRTLALTVYGDLEVSVIDELPPGRLPIRTRWYRPHERDDAYTFLRKRLDAGEQVFVICPLVEDSETLDARSAEEEYERLKNGPLHGYRIDLLHGRMPGKVKDETMDRFARHEADVLVSTSVIEVGIDVPNATVIVIEGAERFGISQLHQFRGRVGRSNLQSYCLLFSTEEEPGPEARERLMALAETNDGFKLAEVDLAMRGEGEAWGKLQSGANTMLSVARLSDRDLLLEAREMAVEILERDPALELPEHAPLARQVRPFLERAAEAN
jgi:ATP-dependent DNA helicase RecG